MDEVERELIADCCVGLSLSGTAERFAHSLSIEAVGQGYAPKVVDAKQVMI